MSQYILKGEALEKQDSLSMALEQYNLALTIAPENQVATAHKALVLSKLKERARQHYEKGLAFDEQGKYESARKEYLSALQNWPDHQAAKEKLSPGGVFDASKEYIVHELRPGESVSKLGLIYYGDLKTYPVIGKFNNLKDVTKVRIGDKLMIPVIEGVSLSSLQDKQKKYFDLKTVEKEGDKITTGAQPAKDPDFPDPSVQDVLVKPGAEEKEAALPGPVEKEMKTQGEQIESLNSEPETPAEPSSFDQALALFEDKKYAQAIPLLIAALNQDPQNETLGVRLFESHFQLGLSRFNEENYLSAKKSFESALSQDPSCEKCPDYIRKCENTYKEKHYNLGIHYFGKEQLQKAIEEWKKVDDIDSGYKDVSSNLKKAELLYERLESIKKGNTE